MTLAPAGATRTMTVTAVQKGIPLPDLQGLLGHDRLTTTGIYLNLLKCPRIVYTDLNGLSCKVASSRTRRTTYGL